MRIEKGSDITKNVKIIEWIKNEILISVSDLFNLIFKGVKPIDDKLQNTLANIIMLTYLLGKRLGISFDEIDYKIKEKSRQGIKEEHSIVLELIRKYKELESDKQKLIEKLEEDIDELETLNDNYTDADIFEGIYTTRGQIIKAQEILSIVKGEK